MFEFVKDSRFVIPVHLMVLAVLVPVGATAIMIVGSRNVTAEFTNVACSVSGFKGTDSVTLELNCAVDGGRLRTQYAGAKLIASLANTHHTQLMCNISPNHQAIDCLDQEAAQ